MTSPVADLHCDLLYYLLSPDSNLNNPALGCSIPHLLAGNVKLQVMAIFAPTQKDSHHLGIRQSEIFHNLGLEDERLYAMAKGDINEAEATNQIGMIAAIESASAFCDENLTLEEGFANLERIRSNVGELFYISMTHHPENRFGGGNYSTVGLKDDGRALLDYLDQKNIAIDFSHASDQLANDILNYLSKHNLKVSVIASHSNYRPVFNHPRNLPDDIAQEIIHQQGLIGLNFLRAFMNEDDPLALYDHMAHGIRMGGENAISYGADYFYTLSHPDRSRMPFYFQEYENARCYSSINSKVTEDFGLNISERLSFRNVQSYLNRQWELA